MDLFICKSHLSIHKTLNYMFYEYIYHYRYEAECDCVFKMDSMDPQTSPNLLKEPISDLLEKFGKYMESVFFAMEN